MYEAKFLLGALAASMADNHRIGYHASVFASGALSEILSLIHIYRPFRPGRVMPYAACV